MMTGCKRLLFIDFETYSSVDIGKCGSYKYIESPDFTVLLVAYAFDYEPVTVLDLTEPDDLVEWAKLLKAIHDPRVTKVAHNCAFERSVIRRVSAYTPPEEWQDTMILASMNGLPSSLDAAGEALNLTNKKMKEGAALIRYFSIPRPQRDIDKGKPPRRSPSEAPDKWATFKEYCGRDVEVTQQIYKLLMRKTKFTELERDIFCTDARINERGVLVDRELASAAIEVDNLVGDEALTEMTRLTGLDNPNSIPQLKAWLEEQGIDVPSLDKAAVSELIATCHDPVIRRALELRQQLGKTSTSKYDTMLRAACADGRVRGITQFYGAGRTGRWAGRLVQLQNLPQNHLDDIADVREWVRHKDITGLELCYDSIPDTLSQLIRTALIAKPGHTFLVADYSAIEARVTAYLACVQWRMETFKNGGDIYCQSASKMFGVPVVKHGVNGHLRQKGKVAELACGYGGGLGAMKAFGADKMGLSDEEIQKIVTDWRTASPEIPKLWRDVEDRARSALENPGRAYELKRKVYDPELARENEQRMGAAPDTFSPYFNSDGIVCRFKRDETALRCLLPSGRELCYWGAEISEEGKITYWAQNQTTRKWAKTDSWGGKLVENIVQAFARDCLATAMVRLDKLGYEICFHVHDEIIAEAPIGAKWEDMAAVMSQPIDWAPGLLLNADGYSTRFYMKD